MPVRFRWHRGRETVCWPKPAVSSISQTEFWTQRALFSHTGPLTKRVMVSCSTSNRMCLPTILNFSVNCAERHRDANENASFSANRPLSGALCKVLMTLGELPYDGACTHRSGGSHRAKRQSLKVAAGTHLKQDSGKISDFLHHTLSQTAHRGNRVHYRCTQRLRFNRRTNYGRCSVQRNSS
jgi:hypothetical protein